ncbi:MAG: hypothetical protein N3B13_12340, partial [Deltaproteobacteria bacterium]|nr:hypothetical protein [Deltaproteobacteria bacterium]
MNNNEIAYNSTICGALKIAINKVEGKLKLTDIDIRFNRNAVSCDNSSRSVTIKEIEGNPSALEYPYPLDGQTTCPLSGSLRISGKYFKTENEYAGLKYSNRLLAELSFLVNNIKLSIDANNPRSGLTDLRGIEGLCLPDSARLYNCMPPLNSGECEAIQGTYISKTGEAKLKYLDKNSNVIANGPIGAEVPQDLCLASAAAEENRIRDSSMFMNIAPNCAVEFIIGNPSYSARKFAGCGTLKLSQDKKSFLIVNDDAVQKSGGSGEDLFKYVFDGNPTVSGTVGKDELAIKMTFSNLQSKGGKYCFSNKYSPSLLVRAVSK